MARNFNVDCKVYVGELGYGAAKQDLEDVFSRYGPLKNVWIARNPPGFAFVEFEDPRDADDAMALDGTRINGRRVRVEMSNGKSRWGSRGPPPARRGGGGGNRDGSRDRDGFRGDRDSFKGRFSRSRSRSKSPFRRRSPPRRRRSRTISRSRSRSPQKSPVPTRSRSRSRSR